MYFGVADNKDKHFHGEIIGLDLKTYQVDKFEDWITKYFRGKTPVCYKYIKDIEMKAAVSMSISPVHVIPTDNGNCNLEIDVEPKDMFCKDIFFPVTIPDGNKSFKKGYFLRVKGFNKDL